LLRAPLGQLGFGFGAIQLGLLPRFLFQLCLGLMKLLQPALPPRQLLRQLVAALALAIPRVLVCSACLSSASISCFNRCSVSTIRA
jgi:hypothetical protein